MTVQEGKDTLLFSVPAFEPNLRLFPKNEGPPIVRTFNGQAYNPEYLLKSETHGIFRRPVPAV